MRLHTTREELLRATKELGLTSSQFRILDEQDGTPVLLQIEAQFVESKGRRWWWEGFRSSHPVKSIHFLDGSGWKHLSDIVPTETAAAWFVAEDSSEFILCEGTIDSILAVIGDCYAFEYYVVSKNLDWLVGENHSDVVYAVGVSVANRLSL